MRFPCYHTNRMFQKYYLCQNFTQYGLGFEEWVPDEGF
jgi:hypothetical protein